MIRSLEAVRLKGLINRRPVEFWVNSTRESSFLGVPLGLQELRMYGMFILFHLIENGWDIPRTQTQICPIHDDEAYSVYLMTSDPSFQVQNVLSTPMFLHWINIFEHLLCARCFGRHKEEQKDTWSLLFRSLEGSRRAHQCNLYRFHYRKRPHSPKCIWTTPGRDAPQRYPKGVTRTNLTLTFPGINQIKLVHLSVTQNISYL